MLTFPPVETSVTGRPILEPGEVEHMFINSVDASMSSERAAATNQQHKDGRAIVTSHRLLWLPSSATNGQPSGMALSLTTLQRIDLKAPASSFFTMQKLHMVVLCDASGVPVRVGCHPPAQQLPVEVRVTFACRDKGSHVQAFYTRLMQLQQEALREAPVPHQSSQTSNPPGPLASGAHSMPPTSSTSVLSNAPSSTLSTEHDALLAQLLAMGFGQHRAAHAALANTSVETALEWLLAQEDDPLLDLPPTTQRYGGGGYGGYGSGGGAGVAGILQREEQKAAATDRSLDQAFKDLNALMTQAGDMVALAQRFRAQMAALEGTGSGGGGNSSGGGSGGDTAVLIGGVGVEARALEDDLVAMGITNPVTKDTAGKAYHKELARQLSDFLAPQLPRVGGMMTLPDVYCLFNRARGTELVSPDDLLVTCRLLPSVGGGLQLHTLQSGVLVIQSIEYSTAHVADRILTLLHDLYTQQEEEEEEFADAHTHKDTLQGHHQHQKQQQQGQHQHSNTSNNMKASSSMIAGLGPGLTAPHVSARLGVPVAIAGEWLLAAESQGVLCRDDGDEGLRFFRNFFEEALVV